MPRGNLKIRPNITVVPIEIQNATVNSVASPGRQSRSKLQIVSPSRRSFHKENNPPRAVVELGSSKRPSPSCRISIGGKQRISNSQLKKSTFNQSKTSSRVNYQSAVSKQKVVLTSIANNPQIPSSSAAKRASSPVRAVYINNRLVTPSSQNYSQPYNHRPTIPQSSLSQVASTFIPQHQRNSSEVVKVNFSSKVPKMLGSQAGTELVIQEQSSMENLKDSYESEMKQIKQLQDEISQNNTQIKQLLQQSRSSIRSSLKGSKAESAQIGVNSRMSIWQQKQEEQKAPQQQPTSGFSKKTIINELNFQTRNKLQRGANYETESERDKSNDEASVQTDNLLPEGQEEKETPSLVSVAKASKLSLTKNHECQLQMVLTAIMEADSARQSLPPNQLEESKVSQHPKNETELPKEPVFEQPQPKPEDEKEEEVKSQKINPLMVQEEVPSFAQLSVETIAQKMQFREVVSRQALQSEGTHEEKLQYFPEEQPVLDEQKYPANKFKSSAEERPIDTARTEGKPVSVISTQSNQKRPVRISNRMYL